MSILTNFDCDALFSQCSGVMGQCDPISAYPWQNAVSTDSSSLESENEWTGYSAVDQRAYSDRRHCSEYNQMAATRM